MNRPWWKFQLQIVFCVQCIAGVALAQTQTSAISASTGGAGRASVEPGDAIFLNPATIAHLQDRNIQTGFSKGAWTLSITENAKDALMPAGFAYSARRLGSEEQELSLKEMRVAVADYFPKRNWTLGITAHQYDYDSKTERRQQWNGDAGLVWTPKKNWGIGLVFSDFLGSNDRLPVGVAPSERTALGMTYIYQEFVRFRFDVQSADSNDFRNPSAMLGYEAFLTDFVILRMGYRQENLEPRQVWTAGLGLDLARFKIHYAYEDQSVFGAEQRHSVDLGIPF